MLGKLFSTAASSLNPRSNAPNASRPTTSLESVQEDIHTRNLLFPDPDTLYQHQHDQVFPLSSSAVPILTSSTNPFDVNAEIDFDVRDVRVVVMQDGGGAALLYDSHPILDPSSSAEQQGQSSNSRVSGRGSISSPRRISLGQTSKPMVITQDNSSSQRYGAFDRRPVTHTRATSYAETEGQRSVREYKEELSVISNCMFGSSEIMARKNIGTKVHIMPDSGKSPPFADGGHGSLGKSSMRGSRLAQSFTSETIAHGPSNGQGTLNGGKASERKRVLITRIFPVPLANTDGDDIDGRTPTVAADGTEPSSYPFPKVSSSQSRVKGSQRLPRKTPMYAIGLIVQLPTTHLSSTPISRSGFRGPGSYTEQESFPSSFNSLKPTGWTVLGNGFGIESLESSLISDIDDRMDVITQHWDIVMRTLSNLQNVISKDLLAMLRQADLSSPDPIDSNLPRNPRMVNASVSVSGKRVEDPIKVMKGFKLPKENAKYVSLFPDALTHRENIKFEADDSRVRISSGIKTLQVVTRQGRWGIWREEARWVCKWAGGREEGFFFYNLLTAFLGNHTEWLQALGPDWYRRRHYQQQRANREEEIPMNARTIVVAHDKMAARRLIFLLSAFLPPNQQQQVPFIRQHRPSTSNSFGGYSQSPPSLIPLNREGSLRRRVNRLNPASKSIHNRTMSSPASGRVENIEVIHQQRRGSDANALKTVNLPIPGIDAGSMKSSAATTTTTVTPVTTIPTFPRRPIRGTGPIPRPGSSGSLATDDLIRSLKRGDSIGSSDSQPVSRWGSLSSLWGPKRRGSTNVTDETSASMDGTETGDLNIHGQSKLAQMVEEASRRSIEANSEAVKASSKIGETPVKNALAEQPAKPSQEPPAIHPAGAYESPVKTSINEDDGVIDIDVPLPDFLTSSFGSAVSSPSSSGFLSSHGGIGPGLEGFEHYSRCGPDDDSPLNTGGWIPHYHPDFVLQAIPYVYSPALALEDKIKASMRAEPTPTTTLSLTPGGEETRWVDISTSIVADATKFTIKRIRLKRLIKLRSASERANLESVPNSFDSNAQQSLYGNPYSVSQLTSSPDAVTDVLEERFFEEPVISMDENLTKAVERIIAHSDATSTPTSNPASRGSSRSTSHVRDSTITTSKEMNEGVALPKDKPKLSAPARLEVPRNECKKTLLSALELIAHEVATSRQEEAIPDTPNLQPHVNDRQESFLREGVRTWLRNVEDGA